MTFKKFRNLLKPKSGTQIFSHVAINIVLMKIESLKSYKVLKPYSENCAHIKCKLEMEF